MRIGRSIQCVPLHRAMLRAAAILAPAQQRAEWLAEWRSELWYVSQASGHDEATAFCLGAFQDALWLRRNSPRPDVRKLFRLESPLQCDLFLVALAAASLFFAFLLPGVRDTIVPSPYRDAHNLVMISRYQHSGAPLPTIPVQEYRSLTSRAQRLFTSLAFYQPILARVNIVPRETAELSIALASGNLFELLGMPISFPRPDPRERQNAASLLLSQTAWSKYFDADPRIVGRILEIAGQPARVAGVISDESWRLPGRFDAWLLADGPRLAALPPHSKGFVLAHLKSASNPPRSLRWRMSAPNEYGGYDVIECASLSKRPLLLAHLLMLIAAFVILPATTSLALGEYPAGRHSPPRTTRLRRWIFLAIKIPLLVLIVFFGSLDLASITSTQIQPHGLLVGYVLAFRWALMDQRKRCPVCLRLLTNPTRIGRSSQTFLEWYGTELMCVNGHGLLHVSEIPTSCYSTQRWLYLDSSWSNLFSQAAPIRSK